MGFEACKKSFLGLESPICVLWYGASREAALTYSTGEALILLAKELNPPTGPIHPLLGNFLVQEVGKNWVGKLALKLARLGLTWWFYHSVYRYVS